MQIELHWGLSSYDGCYLVTRVTSLKRPTESFAIARGFLNQPHSRATCGSVIFFGMRGKWSGICLKLAQYKRSTHTSSMPTFKTQAVSVRVQPHIKAALQTAAERELRSLANMVEVMVVEYCRAHDFPLDGVPSETLPSAQRRKTP